MRHSVQLTIDDKSYTYNVEGDSYKGPDIISVDGNDDLIKGTSFYDSGYISVPFDRSFVLREGLIRLLQYEIKSVVGRNINIHRYHTDISLDEHKKIMSVLYGSSHGLNCDLLPVDVSELEDIISETCGMRVTAKLPGRNYKEFYTRIVRPNSSDHNPPHRDTWVGRLNDAVNIFFPLVGVEKDSSLSLCPGSHRWKESETVRTKGGAKISGFNFTVPSILSGRGCHELIRPKIKMDELLLFSPYLIHGGAKNFGHDTRVSLEMRFWRDING